MSTHSTLHAEQTSQSEHAKQRRLIWDFRAPTRSRRGGWDAEATIVSPERFSGLQQFGHGGSPDEARADLRKLVDSFEAMVGGDYRPAADQGGGAK